MPDFARLLTALLFTCLSTFAHGEKLRIVTDAWPPYVYEELGEVKGIDYEVTAEVFRRLGVEVDWQLLPWKRCLAMLNQGLADGVLDIFQTEERDSQLFYPNEPLSEVEFVLYQATARPHPVKTLSDLDNLTVGTSPGYTYDPAFSESSAFRREPAPTHEANFGKLLLGRIDLLITDRRVGRYLIKQLGLQGQVTELPLVVDSKSQYLAVRRNVAMDLLAQRFAAELKRFKREPAYAELSARYANADIAFPRTVEQQESSTP
ncbi:substrate-binding periplasmic protein [Pseudomonas fontis]|uniref:Transporter substrate-binding domain-containing protein n=1 Tax=Pseudomonas fontis TaxID=2942633 RepID=A0ABT5NNL3_9PSED|nr:transporter substrate-binding domain-containing protein [Pseudomonas fontis]MDD0976002.1 transporter substrate-binding domain-containing protein [Pseudomonas fontis]MDD0989764.1 transporter substrate-binding domain-containing protein [Pseudomonas fontis]